MLTVLTTGTFDLLHPGHVSLLAEIRASYPDCELVVGINGDRRAREIKDVVLFTAEERAAVLRAVQYVDRVVVFEEDTPAELIARLRPDVFAKGPDWAGQEIAEAAVCQRYGVEIAFVGVKTHNSSELKRRVC